MRVEVLLVAHEDEAVTLDRPLGLVVELCHLPSADMVHLLVAEEPRLFIGSRAKGQTAVATDSVPLEIVSEP